MNEPLLKGLKSDSIAAAAAAASSCGKAKVFDAVDPLLSELRKLEKIAAGPPPDERERGGAKLTAAEIRQMTEYRRKTELGAAVRSALQTMLASQAADADELAAIWKEKGEALRAGSK
jgi:hypothetical protein